MRWLSKQPENDSEIQGISLEAQEGAMDGHDEPLKGVVDDAVYK